MTGTRQSFVPSGLQLLSAGTLLSADTLFSAGALLQAGDLLSAGALVSAGALGGGAKWRGMDVYPIEHWLREHAITYTRYDHVAVYTCEEADRHVPPMDAAKTKNVFLTDKKGKRHFLVVVGYEKSVDLAALGPMIGAERLRLASAERMMRCLGVEPGSVTLLGLVNDTEHLVELFLDQPIWDAPAVRSHPLQNTATLSISQEDMRRLYTLTGHTPKVLDVPGRAE